MTRQIFLDANVMLDWVFNRKRFVANATKLLALPRQRKIDIYISSVSVSIIHYMVKKNRSKIAADDVLKRLIPILNILPVDESMVKDAMRSGFKDFEDALQNFCAERARLDIIVTRNPDDFQKSKLDIYTPKVYLNKIGEL